MNSCNNENKMNFPIKISTNNKEQDNYKESDSQPLTSKDSNKDCFKMSVSERNDINSNMTLFSKHFNINNYSNLKLLTKYKNIYVPKIYLINYEDTSIYPPKDSNINESQNNYNYFNYSFSFFNFQNTNSNTNKDYLNYGYSFIQWKVYATEIKNKFDELNELVMKRIIKLPEPSNELEYLLELPSDYGGLGKLNNEHRYSNLKFYDSKIPEKKKKKFMSQIKFEKKMIWFPLHPNPESLSKNYNPFKSQYEILTKKFKVYTNSNSRIAKNESKNENDDITNNTIIQNKKNNSNDNENENKVNEQKNQISNREENESQSMDSYESYDKKERSRNSSIDSMIVKVNIQKKYYHRYSNNYYNKNKYYNHKYKYHVNKYFNRYKNRYSRYSEDYY